MAQTGFTPIQLYRTSTAAAAPTAPNLVAGELAINDLDEKLYFKNSAGTVKLLAASSGASGDVVGPASATDNALARFDATTGKLVQNSSTLLADDGSMVISANSTTDGLRITQLGTGNALLVEDSANPDSSPFVINASGNVGIGTSSPGTKAEISGDVNNTDGTGLDQGQLALTDTVASSALLVGYRYQAGVAEYGRIQARNSSGATNLALQAGGGNVGIGNAAPSEKLDVTGNILASGNITAFSDERLKKDWVTLPNNFVEQLSKVKSGTYSRTDIDQKQVGVSAQSLRAILPEAVAEGEYLSVAYGNAALAACVELAKEVMLLKQKIAEMEAK